jgi:hypothetical protein
MLHEFICREKSGFVPPFSRWLTTKSFNSRAREILLANNGFITDIVPERILTDLIADASTGRNLRYPVLNFLCGAIFTEMWVQSLKN